VGGHDDVAERGSVPQGAGHTDEHECRGGELLDGPFGQDRGGVVALAGEAEHHGGPGPRDGAGLEAGSPGVAVRAEAVQAVADGGVFEVEGGEDHHGIGHGSVLGGVGVWDGGRLSGGNSTVCGPRRKSCAGRPPVVRRCDPAGTMKPGIPRTFR